MVRDANEAGRVFVRESDMAGLVVRWMRSSGMTTVKSEFVTPWGICDLVGVTFNRRNVGHRLRQKQTRAISSVTRALLLLQIPTVDDGGFITRHRLLRRFASSIPEAVASEHVDRLIAEGFVIPSRSRLQQLNGWRPLQKRLVAVELKLSRVDEAMRQALDNLGFAEESYVALPAEVARRAASNRSRWSGFFAAGVGLLGVMPQGCKVLRKARPNRELVDEAIQLYCVEKFWRTHVKGS
jgi:hypothetical protein